MRIEALILDFDGLIVDTETPAFESWQRIYRRHGADLLMSDWAVCVGRGMVFDPHTRLEDILGRSLNRELLAQERRQDIQSAFESLPTLPGVRELIEQARDLGLRLGVASSSPRTWVEGHLKRLELLDRFQVVKCAEDVAHTKPDPELFIAVLNTLAVEAPKAIAFEDSPNGVLAANRAGVFCVVAPNPITTQLSFNGARIDLRVNSLAEVNLRALLARVLERRP